MNKARTNAGSTLAMIGGGIVGGIAGELVKGAAAKVVKDPIIRDVIVLGAGGLGAYYMEAPFLRGIGIGMGISGGVGLAAKGAKAAGLKLPATLNGSRLTNEDHNRIVKRLQEAGSKYRMNGGVPATLNEGIPETLNEERTRGKFMLG